MHRGDRAARAGLQELQTEGEVQGQFGQVPALEFEQPARGQESGSGRFLGGSSQIEPVIE